MKYFHKSVKGTNHDVNQDHFIEKIIDDVSIFAIADGVGGLSYGDIASNLAIRPFKDISTSSISFESLFKDANERILSASEQKNRFMGSTIVSAMVDMKTNEIHISHIGDSRAYIFSNDGMWHTTDDTLVQELVDMGIISEEQAFKHPNKSRLNKALGTCEKLQVKNHTTTLQDDSILLLCSDGLHDYVEDKDIQTIVMTQSPEEASELLIKKARENGSNDDVTIIIAQR
jgi:PPM family protein phosphatase